MSNDRSPRSLGSITVGTSWDRSGGIGRPPGVSWTSQPFGCVVERTGGRAGSQPQGCVGRSGRGGGAITEPIVRRITLDAPPADVWDALIRPERLAAWFGADVELEPRAGAPIAFRMPDGTARRGVVERVEPPARLVFRWRTVSAGPAGMRVGEGSRVAFELAPARGGGTTLTVTESPGILAPEAELLAAGGER
jgi:uncharacterized protein YndB with AHSA1/START domain